MLADCISDNVARLKEGIKHYTETEPFKNRYPIKLIVRINAAINNLDKIRQEIDSSDLENLKP
jgi:hypothetical protein